ncbi:MAG: hypothetical protein HXY34_05355 [Candidatus Thorarchaeota archaeon]|nr:hypothetical protein [Candidatus Thorarchaeota archaeon]
METKSDTADVFKCPVCNGNVRVGPDDVVITCTYCGSTTTDQGKAIGSHLMEPARDRDERVKGLRDFLRANKGMNNGLDQAAEVVENTLLYVPVWTSRVKADSWYKGYTTVQVPVQRTRTVRDANGHMRTETYTTYETGYVPVQDEIHTDTDERLLARKGARFYGLEDFLAKVDLRKTEPYSFEKIKDLGPTILNAEIGQEEYEKAMHGRVADRHRNQAKSKVTELFDCRTTTEVRGTTYLQVPFALLRYKFQGALYKCAVDGNTGKVVLGEIPITKAQRVMWAFIGLIGITIGGAGGEFAYQGMMNDIDSMLIGGIFAALLGAIMALFGMRVLLMTQREKKG